ncbi:AMP-binding protein [Streptomyces tauricus]|uniref:AMP-binding protein n=1 Tax=Streptomyces tauricus TaxID=68274 RepID=UPI002242D50B|nr:AMP-binding protein [Streptomyces tauricus]MCW8096362.1 AMP-binding protein [Streptomyces tauricus]
MSQRKTADHERLLGWLDAPSDERGMRFRLDDGSWQRLTYRELARRTLGAGAALADAGVRPGDVVPLVVPGGEDFVTQFFGLLAIGATPSVLPLPLALRAGEGYQSQLKAITARIHPRHAVADPRYHDIVAENVARIGGGTEVIAPRYEDRPGDAPRAWGDLAVLQFTSGSRGSPRALRVSVPNLAANLRMIGSWMDPVGHGAVTWLPLYHDMGLVGGLLGALTLQVEHALMRPEQFVRDTPGWLAEYGRTPYTCMCMPNFGFERVLATVRPEHLEGLDFSALTAVVSGAERIDPAVLARFAALLGPYGFDVRALMPAYGLAEGTLAVTGVGKGDLPRLVRVGGLERRLGEKLDVRESAELSTEPVTEPWNWQVSCGPPLESTRVEILDEEGAPQPEGVLGEIFVQGPSVAEGYADATPEDLAKLGDGKLHTGDAGFLLEGELYVIGRLGDSVKINGQNVFVEDIELELVASGAVSKRYATVVAGVVRGEPRVLVVTERPLGDRLEDVLSVITSFTGDAGRAEVLSVKRGTIPLTSSRKPRRRSLWLAYLAGELKERSDS